MKTPWILVVVSSCVLSPALLKTEGLAQEKAPAPNTDPGVRVIDITSIFKQHSGFQAEIEAMKKDVIIAEGLLKREAAEIKRLVEQMNMYKIGSTERKKLEEKISSMKSEFSEAAQRGKADFLERESEIYYDLYRKVKEEVRLYSEENNISLVLRFSSKKVEENRTRKDRLRAMNRPVVYERKGVDITQVILDRLEKRRKVHTVAKPVVKVPLPELSNDE